MVMQAILSVTLIGLSIFLFVIRHKMRQGRF